MKPQPVPCPPLPSPAPDHAPRRRLAILLALPVLLLLCGLEVVATPEHIAAMDPTPWLGD